MVLDLAFRRRAALVVLTLAMSACSIERNRTAEQAEAKLIGLTRAELYRCAGLPHRSEVIDGVEIATYDNQLTTSNALTLPFIGGGLTQGTNNYCRTTVTIDRGAVRSVNYAGDTGPFYAEHEQCAFTVRACVKFVDERARLATQITAAEHGPAPLPSDVRKDDRKQAARETPPATPPASSAGGSR